MSELTTDFNSEFYKSLLRKDKKESDIEEVEASEVPISFGLPTSAIDSLTAQKEIQKDNIEQAKKVSKVFEDLFDELNKKYGLSIHFKYNDLMESLTSIIEPRNMKAMELYLSEGYSRFRLILYQQYLSAIALISSQVFDPKYLLSESLTFADKMITIEKLMEFMEKMNTIYDQVKVDHSTSQLQKMGEEGVTQKLTLDDPKVKDFLEQFTKSIEKKN